MYQIPMKKTIISTLSFVFFYTIFTFGQSATLQSDNTHLSTKGFDASSNTIILGQIYSRPGTNGSTNNDLVISSNGNYPLSFRIGASTQMRLNNYFDLGVGTIALYLHDATNFATNNTILSKVHAYGVGGKSLNYGTYFPFKSAMLGQALTVAASQNAVGVMGMSDGSAAGSAANIGVLGIGSTTATITGYAYNFWGDVVTSTPQVVAGLLSHQTNNGTGEVYGTASFTSAGTGSGTGYGTFNDLNTNTGIAYGVYNDVTRSGNSGSNRAYGTYNIVSSNSTSAYGTYNDLNSTASSNIFGNYNKLIYGGSGNAYGVYNELTTGTTANNSYLYGVYSNINNTSTNVLSRLTYGGYFSATSTSASGGYGVYASGNTYGIYASSAGNAGFFNGNITVTGTINGAAKPFKIDHPLDPENKYLFHVAVESPDMKNIYDGNIITDANGNATIILPTYFDALNKDFRYQLTTVGQFAQVMVATEIAGNQFTIKSDKPNVKVSWQVTGIREDAWANANRIMVEVDKVGEEKGKYIHPAAFGKSATMGESFSREEQHRKGSLNNDENSAPPKPQAAFSKQRETSWGPIVYPKPIKEEN
jgi:hypothetical protein